MEDWRKRVAALDALEATGKLVVWNGRDTQLRMRWMRQTDLTQLRVLWRRHTNLSCATEESRNSGCVGSDIQICRVERTRYATPGALDVTDRFATTPDASEATDKIVLRD